jgi:hypothetical protein
MWAAGRWRLVADARQQLTRSSLHSQRFAEQEDLQCCQEILVLLRNRVSPPACCPDLDAAGEATPRVVEQYEDALAVERHSLLAPQMEVGEDLVCSC